MNIVWFRNDLRASDNPALWHAAQDGPVIALYIATPDQWRSHDLGGPKVDFILRNVAALSKRLQALNIPLLVETVAGFDQAADTVERLAVRHGARGVYWNEEYPLDEMQRDDRTADLLRDHGIEVHRYHDRVLAPPGSVTKDDGEPYKIFTPFKRRWMQLLDLGAPDLLPVPARQSSTTVKASPVPESLKGFGSDVPASLWPEGEKEAGKRLAAFCDDRLDDYERQRDFPAEPATSRLSPYLAAGVLSPQQCLRACLDSGRGEGPDAWLNELVWRDFYQHIVWAFPHVCKNRPFKPETDAVPWRDSDKDFSSWAEGRTGVPLVDAGMRELRETGWMHNRVRMVAAMFLSKNLLLDWRRGERFFMNCLVDGDFAANNGGWQWSASTGTDAVPYFRVFNPFTQGKRFDPDGEYIKRFVPELADLPASRLHDPDKLAACRPDSYPPVCVDVKSSRQRAIDAFRQSGI